ncbi:hypothetical protein OROGR_030117 [Orobanche gracilis]
MRIESVGMESIARPANLDGGSSSSRANGPTVATREGCAFQMPLHYPRYTRAEYEAMPEWKLDCLLAQYGLHTAGNVDHKRKFAMGAFLWTR